MSKFEGFEPANTTPVPDILFDELLSELSESELKVLLYIIRRTSGFKKTEDAISLTQFQNGITKRTGEVLDRGCGIKNRTTLSKALASLEKKGCIVSEKRDDPQGDKATTVYKVRFQSDGVVRKTYHGSTQNVPQVVTDAYHGSTQEVPGVVRKTYPQETVIQETDKQLDSRQEGNEVVATSAEDRNAPSPIDFIEQKQKRDTDPRIPAIPKGQAAHGNGSDDLPRSGNDSNGDNVQPGTSGEAGRQVGRGNMQHDRGRQAEAESQLKQIDSTKVIGQTPVQRSGVSPSTGTLASPDAAQRGKKGRNVKKEQPAITLTEQQQAFWMLWCNMWFNIDIPPKLNETAYSHVVKLAPHITTEEQMKSITEYAREELGDFKRKRVFLGNLEISYPGWKQTQHKKPQNNDNTLGGYYFFTQEAM